MFSATQLNTVNFFLQMIEYRFEYKSPSWVVLDQSSGLSHPWDGQQNSQNYKNNIIYFCAK